MIEHRGMELSRVAGKRVFVTGSRGFLGTCLVPHLKERGHEVVECVANMNDQRRPDLTDPIETERALDIAQPDVIVNLAALTNVDACERDPQHAFRANVRIVENLARWVGTSGLACHLVQLSTDQVYDGERAHRENDVTLSNYYGYSKYAGELMAGTVSSTVIRTNFFGPSRLLGRVSLSDWIATALRDRRPITVFDDIYFSPLTLERVVEFLEHVIARTEPGVFNLGSRDGMSKAEFAFALARALGLPTDCVRLGKSEDAGLAAYRPKDMRMDPSRFERTFGVAMPTLADEITATAPAYAQ